MFVQMRPMEPSESADVWRLEMHDTDGRTLRAGEEEHPAPDAITPDKCANCDSMLLSLAHAGEHIEARCSDCGHEWRTGHANDSS